MYSHGHILASLDGTLRPVSVGIPDSTFRSSHSWNIIHIVWQLAGIFAFIAAACFAILTVDFGNPKTLVNTPHYYLGITILGLALIMVILGSIAQSNVTNANDTSARRTRASDGCSFSPRTWASTHCTRAGAKPTVVPPCAYRWVLYVGIAILLMLGFVMAEITMGVVLKGGLAAYLFERSQQREGLDRVSEDVGKAN
ncbi:hypothetical protein BJ742DRAFT_770134 [Cladochytrium replicatum]|nr:hypothetical protein BJ742DRAFT_770134 [Cladochytrium replicatum]